MAVVVGSTAQLVRNITATINAAMLADNLKGNGANLDFIDVLISLLVFAGLMCWSWSWGRVGANVLQVSTQLVSAVCT